MDMNLVEAYWAPGLAGLLLAAVALIAAVRLWRISARGRLAAANRALRQRNRQAAQSGAAVARAEARVGRLEHKRDSVKPRLLEEARGTLGDALALAKIADDQVLIARNRLRHVILEEFPPGRHEALRRRYLGDDGGS